MLNLLKKTGLPIILTAFLLAGFAASAIADPGHDSDHLLIMAAVSDDPKKLQGAMQPMADYMARKLSPLGIESIEIVVVESIDQMVRLLRDGRVDWVTETAYAATTLEERADAEILLRKWKQGVPEYRSIVFTLKDSQLDSLRDLGNGRVAFQHPGSTTGYFLPASELAAAGHSLRRLASIHDQPRPGSLGFLFSGTEYNTVMWVHKGLVDAGVLSNLDWQNDAFLPPGIRDDLKIIHTSRPIPRALELVRRGLNPRIKAALKQALLSAHNDPDAEQALRAYHQTARFDELDEDARLGLQGIRELRMRESGSEGVAP